MKSGYSLCITLIIKWRTLWWNQVKRKRIDEIPQVEPY